MRFIHAADIHLGYRQYNNSERYNDFARAFHHMVDDVIRRKADFVLLAGDLFHKRSIEPRTLLQATAMLERLRNAGIPVIAIEGNHERAYQQDGFSWLDYLAEVGLLTLLTPIYRDGRIQIEPWDAELRSGAYIDLPGGVRIIGVKYYGASTPRVIQDLCDELESMSGPRPPYTIIMLHAGVHGVLDNMSGALSRAQLDPLRAHCQYLALGHIHKPFIQDDWIYNPGSLETNSVTEVEWDDRGYLMVDIDMDAADGPTHSVTAVPSSRRPFIRLRFAVDECRTPEHLYTMLEAYLRRRAPAEPSETKPVVELQLYGILPFSHSDLDLKRVEGMAQEALNPLICNVRDITTPSEFDMRVGDNMSRAELEQYVIRELIERDIRRRDNSQQWADMVLRLKGLALSGGTPEEVVAELSAFRAAIPPESLGDTKDDDKEDAPL